MRFISAKALAAGAICAAWSGVFMMVGQYIPLLGIVAVFASGLPMVYLCVLHGKKITVLSAVVAVLVLFAVTGNILIALFCAVTYLLPGVAVGFVINGRKPYPVILGVAGAAVVLGLLLELFLINQSGGGNGVATLITAATEQAKGVVQTVLAQVPETEGIHTTELLAVANQTMDTARDSLLLYLPAIIVCIAGIIAYGVVAVSVFMLSRTRVLAVPYLPFSQIRSPKWICIVSVLLYLIIMLASDGGQITAVMQNMSAVTDAFLAVCGLSLIDCKLSSKISSGYVRAVIYAAVFLVGYALIGLLVQGLIILGLLDGMIEFPRNPKAGEKNEKLQS